MRQDRSRRRDVDGILLLDKPLGLSSNQALQQVKRLYRAAKAGHTGSLDPLATGMLPICLGQATKLSAYLLESDKRYLATVALGVKTSTGDAEGQVVATSDPAGVTPAMIERALAACLGRITQVPPMHSALKHQGQRLYDLAREGIEVEREPREVTIHAIALTGCKLPRFEIDVRCSKGTYVRTLAEDIAASLGQAGHLAALRRLEVTPFGGLALVTPEAIEAAADDAARDALLLAPVAALSGWPQVTVDADRAHYLAQGQAVRIAGAPREGLVAVLSGSGRLLGIAQGEGGGMIAPRRWLGAGPLPDEPKSL
jgi:tRNA pseudouridine55 synthase